MVTDDDMWFVKSLFVGNLIGELSTRDAMVKHNEQICCIIDEYGCFEGILSLEDVIETLLGSEIIDENDMVPDMQAYARERWQKRQEKKGSKK